MHEALLPIVNERRSKYTRLVSLLVLSFATLVAFHFLIFDPYLDAATSLIETQKERARFDALKSNIEKRQEAYASLKPKVEAAMGRGLETLMDSISEDLSSFSDRVQPLLPETLQADSPESRRLRREREAAPMMQMQMQMQSNPPPNGESSLSSARLQRLPIPNETRAQLERSNDWSSIRRALQPEVQKHVIDVRFSEYNEKLQRQMGEIAAALEEANAWKPEDPEELPPDLLALWEKVRTASEEAAQTVRSIQAEVPREDSWWWSREGKDQAGTLELNRSTDLMEKVSREIGYDAILASLQSQLATLQKSIEEVIERQAEIEEKFAAFQETIVQLLGPLDWLPLNLDDLVFMMPLLVACAFGGGYAWVMSRRRAYDRLLDTCKEKSEAVRELSFTLELENGTGRVRVVLIACTLVAAAWIVYANIRLAAFESLQTANEAFTVIQNAQSSAFLNWGASLALLLVGFVASYASLSRIEVEE